MHVRTIDLTRFTCHASLRVDLPPRGIVLITGPNGAGKTTVVEAVAWAVFGESVRGADPWPDTPGHTAAMVDLDFAGPDNPSATPELLRVRRTATVASGKGGKVTVRTHLDWRYVAAPVGPHLPAVTGDATLDAYAAPPSDPGHGHTAPGPTSPARPAPPVYENATKSEGALRERVGPFSRWVQTHVFLARDAARFAAATDGERKRALEAILGLDAFDAALKTCRTEAREVAARLATADGRITGWREAHTRAHARATAPLPEAPTPEVLDALRAARDTAQTAYTQATTDYEAASRQVGHTEGERAAAARVVDGLEAALRALTAPPPAALPAGPPGALGTASRVPPPAPVAPPACPTCKRPWGPATAPRPAMPAGTAPAPGAPSALAGADPGHGHSHDRPHDHPTPEPPDPTPIREALAAARVALDAARAAEDRAAGAAYDARRTRDHRATNLGALTARVTEGERAAAVRAEAQRARDAAAREAEALAATIAEAEAASAEDRAEAAALAAADTALGLGGIRARILAHALPFLGHRATTWLSRLGRPDWRVTFTSTLKTGVRGAHGEEAITMALDGPAKAQYGALSGGEAKRVDLALLLALGELATAIHGAPTGTLWFDEVLDAPLDADGAAAAGEALRTLARDRAVVVIAHSPAVVRALRPTLHLTFGPPGPVTPGA